MATPECLFFRLPMKSEREGTPSRSAAPRMQCCCPVGVGAELRRALITLWGILCAKEHWRGRFSVVCAARAHTADFSNSVREPPLQVKNGRAPAADFLRRVRARPSCTAPRGLPRRGQSGTFVWTLTHLMCAYCVRIVCVRPFVWGTRDRAKVLLSASIARRSHHHWRGHIYFAQTSRGDSMSSRFIKSCQ
jgi:hypothetical protein